MYNKIINSNVFWFSVIAFNIIVGTIYLYSTKEIPWFSLIGTIGGAGVLTINFATRNNNGLS